MFLKIDEILPKVKLFTKSGHTGDIITNQIKSNRVQRALGLAHRNQPM
jgi:hypothetical protein